MNYEMARAWFLEHFALGGEIHEDALKKGFEAIEKQIPKKPKMRHIKRYDRYNDGWCPNCGKYVQEFDYDYKYCQDCGQALDWRDSD